MNIFRSLRKERNLTQKQLADLLYLDQTTVSKWEVGKATPDYGTLQKLANFYGVSTDLLLNRNDTDSQQAKKNPITDRPPSDITDNFINEFGSLFSEENYIKLSRLYKLMNERQIMLALGILSGILEESGVHVKGLTY